MFSGRGIYFANLDTGIKELISEVPDNEIICDACNALIETDDVLLLCYIRDGIEYCWGAECQDCADKLELEEDEEA
jgi:hypothetical protein